MYVSTQSMIRNTLGYIAKNNEEKDLHRRRIVTGQRIFTPMDDPAGDSISRRMRYDLLAIDQATRNTQNNQFNAKGCTWCDGINKGSVDSYQRKGNRCSK